MFNMSAGVRTNHSLYAVNKSSNSQSPVQHSNAYTSQPATLDTSYTYKTLALQWQVHLQSILPNLEELCN